MVNSNDSTEQLIEKAKKLRDLPKYGMLNAPSNKMEDEFNEINEILASRGV